LTIHTPWHILNIQYLSTGGLGAYVGGRFTSEAEMGCVELQKGAGTGSREISQKIPNEVLTGLEACG